MPVKISFCVTSRNRLWQLRETLPGNLQQLGDSHEIMLVDYGSNDGMAEWVWSNFRGAIDAGRLRFFEVRNRVHWSSPCAKNLAHRLARGDYLFNLDADNRIHPGDVNLILQAAEAGVPCHQSNGMADGSFGRIGLPRRVFDEMGGYDENLLPVGGQDVNLLARFKMMGLKMARLPVPSQPPVQNTHADKLAEMPAEKYPDEEAAKAAFLEMLNFNRAASGGRIGVEGPRYMGGYASYRGLLNGEPVTIDGFNVIRPDDPKGW